MIDLKYVGSDFERSLSVGITEVQSVFNMSLLALFGGNVEQSEPLFREKGEVVYSWWGNSHGLSDNSSTERFLRDMVLSTSTPDKLTKVILNDLSFLNDFMDISVEVTIPQANRVNINIFLTDKKTGKTEEINYIWNALMDDLSGLNNDDSFSSSFGLDYVLEFPI